MNSATSWKLFQLFDLIPIKDPNYRGDEPLFSDNTLSAACSTTNYLVIAVNNSYIRLVTKEFTLHKQFKAYDIDYRINFMRTLAQSNLVITLAEKQGFPSILKLWDLNKISTLSEDVHESNETEFKYHTQVVIPTESSTYPISCFQFNKDLTCVCIGYTNGKVILVRGDLIRDRGSKQRVIYEAHEPITNVHFNNIDQCIYVTTTSKVLSFVSNGRNQGRPTQVLSNKTGVDLNCADTDQATQQLVVGTSESIKFYNSKGKSHVIAFQGRKKKILRYSKNYLLVVSTDEEVGNGSYSEATNYSNSLTRIMILDLRNRLIYFSLTLTNSSVSHVFAMWGDLYLLSSDGVLYKLHENSINQQIEVFLQRDLFQIAYDLAVANSLSTQMLLKIQNSCGDHLYSRQEYEEAAEAYNKCLELYKSQQSTESANQGENGLDDFVLTTITKFKDVSNIKILTAFLSKLYELDLSENDHITLLLCCYCKLKLIDNLNKFIDDLSLSKDPEINQNTKVNLQELDFQLIINLFRECGYYEQLIKLLYKLNQPGIIVGILLNDMAQPKQCLDYMKTLMIDDLFLIFTEYSKALLDCLPIETTQLLIEVFTGRYIPRQSTDGQFDFQMNESPKEHPSNKTNTSVLNSYQAFLAYVSGRADGDKSEESPMSSASREPTYLPPKLSLVFPSFINNPNEFVIFLEACVDSFDKHQGSRLDKQELLMTLLEMYISLSKSDTQKQAEWKHKATQLLQAYRDFFDEASLLLISHIYDFEDGEIEAFEHSGYNDALFRLRQVSKDVKGCLEVVHKHGDEKPELYREMLKFTVSEAPVFNQVAAKEFAWLISKIKEFDVCSPLEIIQITSSNELASIGLIKDYLIDYISTQTQEIENNARLVDSYERDSAKLSIALNDLTTKPYIIQNNKCSLCKLLLEYPVVHFKCKHSYHQHCLNESAYVSPSGKLDLEAHVNTCPLCFRKLSLIQGFAAEQTKAKEDLDLFNLTLDEATDRFQAMSTYLGKGIMDDSKLL